VAGLENELEEERGRVRAAPPNGERLDRYELVALVLLQEHQAYCTSKQRCPKYLSTAVQRW